MKKIVLTLAVFGMLSMPAINSWAQETNPAESAEQTEAPAAEDAATEGDSTTAGADSVAEVEEAPAPAPAPEKPMEMAAEAAPEQPAGRAMIRQKFIEGDWRFMSPVLICLILGLAIAIERIISLNLKSVNAQKLLGSVEAQLKSKNVEGAKKICRDTRGPIASIFYQGLDRHKDGIDIVEKSVVSYGSVQMGLLEKGLVWLSLFISLAPMLGFMGTVIGMIQAFDQIEAMGDISPSAVAGGIKVALLTTVAGLIVAIILQIFYNYIVSKIDGMVNSMEDSSITLVDMMNKYDIFSK